MFKRDDKTKALINTDDNYYKSVLALRESQKRERALQDNVDKLKQQFEQLHSMVDSLISNKGK